jgi:hypothetical protein
VDRVSTADLERRIGARPAALAEDHHAVPGIADASLDGAPANWLRGERICRRKEWALDRLRQAGARERQLGAEDPLPELQVGAADDAAGNAAGREVDGGVRRCRCPATRAEHIGILLPVEVAEGAAELAADIEPAPVGQVLGVRHRDAWNSVGSGICRAERKRCCNGRKPQWSGDKFRPGHIPPRSLIPRERNESESPLRTQMIRLFFSSQV